jgi:hypothetical protein
MDETDGYGFMGAPHPAGAISGPGASTDHAIVRWDGTTGTAIGDSQPTVEDDGTIAHLTDPAGLQDAATKHYVDAQIAAIAAGGAAQNSFIVSGGQVVWDSAYIFVVSTATYYIDGVLYESAAASVTLGAADVTHDRIDVIAVDDTGAVVVVAGTAAAQPSEPDIDPGSQLKLSIVLVSAATTEPAAALSELLYADNVGAPTEWAWTASGAAVNVNSINNPRSGTKSIEGTSVGAGVYAQAQIGSGSFDPSRHGLLVLYLRSKAAWGNNRGLQVSLRLAGVIQGSAVSIARTGTWGFDSGITATYQQVAIPVAQFAIPAGTVIAQVRIADFGGSIGFYLDDISFQGGATNEPFTGLTQALADARYRRLSLPLNLAAAADVTGQLPLANVAALPGTIGVVFDGGGSPPVVGTQRWVKVPYAHTITVSDIFGDVPGSAVVDVWRDTYANFPPTDADSITASAPPTLSAAAKNSDSTLTGWSTAGAAGSIYMFNLDSASTLTVVTVQLTVTRT